MAKSARPSPTGRPIRISPSPPSPHNEPKGLSPTVEYGPLIVFFVAYFLGGLLTATAALMAATAAALVLSLAVRRKVPLLPVITAAIVGVFGGLTLWLEDEIFIKM